MSTTDAPVGMMDAAYFTGRRELLDFFNDLLDMNLKKIEETASGAVACQLIEYIFKGSIPMSRVNWEARSDYEYVQNYKLLQAAFTRHKVRKDVDVSKLIRGKYQDNLEFCQWLKAFFDQQGVFREDYDPAAVRAKGKGGKKVPRRAPGGSFAAAAPPLTNRNKPPRSKPLPSTSKPVNKENKKRSDSSELTDALLADAELMKKNADLNAKVKELETAVGDAEREREDAERERDFYFEKLRSVEILLQVHQERGDESDPSDMVERVFKVLYATAEDNVVVGDDGEFVEVFQVPDELDAPLD